MRHSHFLWLVLSAILINSTWTLNAAAETKIAIAPKVAIETSSSVAANLDWQFKTCKAFGPSQPQLIRREGATAIYQMSFTACDGNAIHAYWVTPETSSSKKMPAVLFVHWLDFEVPDSNQDEFLLDSLRLAKQGVTSLLVSTFWSVPSGRYKERKWENDYANTLNQTRDLLQALQWIKAQKNIDLKRVAYVGHDYGATFGVLVSAIDQDIKAFALMAPIAKFTDWYLYGSASGIPQNEQKEEFIKSFLPINPENMIKQSKAIFLLQYAQNDHYISRAQAEQLIQVAPPKTQTRFYPIDHSMKIAEATEDRILWLQQVLELN